MKAIYLLFISICLNYAAFSQTPIDSIFRSIHNDKLYVSISFGGDMTWKKNQEGEYYPTRDFSNRRMYRVSTFSQDIVALSKLYSEKEVCLALYRLLSDSTRDLFANALLYELLDNKLLGKLVLVKRSKWVASGKRDMDLMHWEALMRSKDFIH